MDDPTVTPEPSFRPAKPEQASDQPSLVSDAAASPEPSEAEKRKLLLTLLRHSR